MGDYNQNKPHENTRYGFQSFEGQRNHTNKPCGQQPPYQDHGSPQQQFQNFPYYQQYQQHGYPQNQQGLTQPGTLPPQGYSQEFTQPGTLPLQGYSQGFMQPGNLPPQGYLQEFTQPGTLPPQGYSQGFMQPGNLPPQGYSQEFMQPGNLPPQGYSQGFMQPGNLPPQGYSQGFMQPGNLPPQGYSQGFMQPGNLPPQGYSSQGYQQQNLQGQQSGYFYGPTVFPCQHFSAEADAKHLHKAMKGLGTDEGTIVEITGNRNNDQRIEIRAKFQSMYGKDLLKKFKDELSGSLEYLVVSCYQSPIELALSTILWAIKGAGTNEQMLNLVIATLSPSEMDQVKDLCRKKHDKSLESFVSGDTSFQHKKLLLSLISGSRDTGNTVDMNLAKADANELYKAGQARWGTDEGVFHKILTSRNYNQLRQTFIEYSKICGNSINSAINSEMSGDGAAAFQILIDYINDPIAFYANQFMISMKGLGTHDHLLCYLIVSRSERDLQKIYDLYLKMFKKPLKKDIKNDTSGKYERLLLLLIGNN